MVCLFQTLSPSVKSPCELRGVQTSITELKALGKPPRECIDVVAACGFLLKQAGCKIVLSLCRELCCPFGVVTPVTYEEKRKLDWKGCQKMMQSPQQSLGRNCAKQEPPPVAGCGRVW